MISSGVLCRELIGRSAELAFLRDRVASGERRASALVVVRGEAGIGKTRLIAELLATASAAGFATATGGAREYANAPYAAIAEALAHFAVDVPAELEESEPGGKARRFDAIAEGIARAARAAPRGLVVAVEDVHWADVATIELLRFLATRLAAHTVTFVVTYRVDEIEADTSRARAIAALERDAGSIVTLDALSAKDIETLLRTVMRGAERTLAQDVVARIRDLSDGRPLFAEELLRGVFERVDRDAHAVPTVPTTIRVTVRERFASLSDRDRGVLLHAAVIGRRFSARFVGAFAGEELGVVYGALRRARDLQLVVEERDEDGDAFAFRHALTREAVYDELLRAEARLMHAKVADALASEPAPDAAAVADHFRHAGESASAGAWSERAGDEAFAVYAYGDAARAYERAYELTADDARRGSLAERAANAWYALGDLLQSIDWYAKSAAANEAAGKSSAAWRSALRRARVLFEVGRFEAGMREADRLATAAEADPALRIDAQVMVAGLLTAHGRGAEALARLRLAEPLLSTADLNVHARFSATYAMALGLAGEPERAREQFHLTVAHARAVGDDDLVLRTYNNWGNCELACGSLARASSLYGETLRGAEETKNHRILAWTTQNAALVRIHAGDFAGARALLERIATIEHGLPLAHRWSLALLMRANTLEARLGNDDEVRLATALDEAIDEVDITSIAMLASALASRLAAADRPGDAGAVVGRVLPLFDVFEVPFWLADAASRYGDRPSRDRARELTAASAATPAMRSARAVLAMLDAREALRRRRRDAGAALASEAAALFHAAGSTLDEAYALELAGRPADALALFRRIGAAFEVRRLTATRPPAARRRGEATLTEREREVAALVAAGRPTRAVAAALVISERTVETHIASVYRKLGVSSRRELEALLAATPPVSP